MSSSRIDPELKRMWINQPSTLQPLYHLHGVNVLAHRETDRVSRVYFLSGDVIDQQVPSNTLSEGWRIVDEKPILETRPFVTLSTGHLSQETAYSLDSPYTRPCLGGPYGDYGWFVYAHDENGDESIPTDLWRVMCWAKLQDIHHILFDRDADTVSELPTYDW